MLVIKFEIDKNLSEMREANYSFPKSLRLCSHNTISDLFTNGEAFVCYPFRVVYLNVAFDDHADSKVLISVSKKKFKRAVWRNLIKRRCKEAYRLHRKEFSIFLQENNKQIAFALVYLPKEILDYHVIEKGMIKMLNKLMLQMKGDE